MAPDVVMRDQLVRSIPLSKMLFSHEDTSALQVTHEKKISKVFITRED